MSVQLNTVVTAKALIGQVLGVGQSVIGISRNDGKKGKSGLVMVVEVVTVNTIQALLLNSAGEAWIRNCIESLQGKIASAASGSVIGKQVDSKLFSVESLLQVMSADVASQRLSKESIGAWFDADLAALWSARIRAKLPTISDDKLAKLLEVLRDSYCALAGREVSMEEKKVEQLVSGIDMLGDDYSNPIADKVSAKLLELANKPDLADLLEGI